MSFIYPEKGLIGYVMIKNIHIQNANAVSSPITYGFPAISGFTGAIHALSRKISTVTELEEIRLDGVLIGCHDCQPQTYREASYRDYTFNQTRNPVLKSGKTASIIEEGRCHLRVSLIIGVYADSFMLEEDQIDKLLITIKTKIQQQRIAGGSVHSLDKFNAVTYKETEEINDFSSSLLPAFVLMNAQKELADITCDLQKEDSEATALDALIKMSTLHHVPNDNSQGTINWQTQTVKKGRGWLVPIPIGYQGISDLYDAGVMQNIRNPEYPSQYVEAVYSLGKWVFPHRIDNLADALWYQDYDKTNGRYLVNQNSDA